MNKKVIGYAIGDLDYSGSISSDDSNESGEEQIKVMPSDQVFFRKAFAGCKKQVIYLSKERLGQKNIYSFFNIYKKNLQIK